MNNWEVSECKKFTRIQTITINILIGYHNRENIIERIPMYLFDIIVATSMVFTIFLMFLYIFAFIRTGLNRFIGLIILTILLIGLQAIYLISIIHDLGLNIYGHPFFLFLTILAPVFILLPLLIKMGG